ncbi:hypothetical protein [Paraburkholderia graminis]
MDALHVLEALGGYCKRDSSYRPTRARTTVRYHVNVNGRDWEFLLNGAKFWDTRTQSGGGGAVDLVMHLFSSDFARAVKRLRAVLGSVPSTLGIEASPRPGKMSFPSAASEEDDGNA